MLKPATPEWLLKRCDGADVCVITPRAWSLVGKEFDFESKQFFFHGTRMKMSAKMPGLATKSETCMAIKGGETHYFYHDGTL